MAKTKKAAPAAKPTTDPSSTTAAANPDDPVSAAPVKLQAVTIKRQRIGFLGWKPDKPDIRDRRLTAGEPGTHPPKATLDGKLLPVVRDQGNQGSCTGHATRTAVAFKKAQNGEARDELAPRFIYYNGRLIEGLTDQDSGCEIRDVVKGVAKLGVCTEKLCPYSDRGRSFLQRPTSAAYNEALTDLVTAYQRVPKLDGDAHDLDAIRASIVDGNPIVFGFTVYENFMDEDTARDGIMREPEGGTDGGHAVCIVGYDDEFDFGWTAGGVLIVNSWGADWGAVGPNGQRGYFWMPWVLAENPDFCDDLWSIDMVQE